MSEVNPVSSGLVTVVHLQVVHDTSGFVSGASSLDSWLRERALANEADGFSRTFVVAHGPTVVGFYSLAPAVASHATLNASLRRNAPDPVPMLLLARLAVDRRYAGTGVGTRLVLDALRRSILVAEHIGVRALSTHPKDDAASRFYQRFGFKLMPASQPRLMVLPMNTIGASFAEAARPEG